MGLGKSSSQREQYVVRESYLKKQEKHQIDSLTLHLKKGRKIKSIKLEMKKERLQQTTQKCKGS